MVISIPLLSLPFLQQNPHQPPHNPSQGQPCPHRPQTFLHALTHIPLNKGMLGTHQLVVQASPDLSDGCGVAQDAHSSLDWSNLHQVPQWELSN